MTRPIRDSIRPLLAGLLLAGTGLLALGPAPTATASPIPSAILAHAADDHDDAKAAEAASDDAVEPPARADLTLKRLFDSDEPRFGPGASGAAFSASGRYAAYLYRPRIERRHGSDLWLLDTETGETTRVTKVSVMSRWQAATRAVRDDRIEKARKHLAKQKGAKGASGDDDAAEAPATDPLSGEWAGTLRGDEDLELQEEGLEVALSLQVREGGRVTGTVRTSIASGTVTAGRWDADARRLNATIIDPDTGLEATIDAEIDEDGTMRGRVRVDAFEADLELVATRTEVGRDAGVAEDAEDADDDGDASGEDDGRSDDELADMVLEDDAEDRRAPRYGGVSSFTWAPEADELLFTSGGDVYRYVLEDGSIERRTVTKEFELGVQYLPDGSGFAYQRDRSVVTVRFGDSLVEEIDPRLPGGQELSSFRISPDGSRLALVATRGTSWWGSGISVNIISYRQRFATVRQAPRHMPDNAIPDYWWHVYLYDLDGHREERGVLSPIAEHKMSGPRDVVQVPEFSPDSSRAAFAIFDQGTSVVRILESRFPEPEAEDADETDGEGAGKAPSAAELEKKDREARTAPEARTILRFMHDGGPNTPDMIRPVYLADSLRVAFIAEQSGYRHLHVLDPRYEHLQQVTTGRYEVYPLRLSRDHRTMFVTATKEHPTQLDAYKVDLESFEMTRLTPLDGTWSGVAVNDAGTHLVGSFVDFGVLRELHHVDTAAKAVMPLTDSHTKEARVLTAVNPEYFTFENRHGQEIHGHWFRPDGWTAEDERPLLIYVYGGPLGTRNMTSRGDYSAASYFFAMYMARKHGWVTATIDPRGVSGYGGLFEKSNFEQVGKPQTEDLVDGARWLAEHAGVDESRMAMHGWSFGGFQTQMVLYTEPDVFAAGIAGAGPTEWENYNTWYSTGTIGESRTGKTDLGKYSLLPLAKNLKARLLLVHGMEDSNVLYQDTVRVYRELLQAGKETLVELFLDPTGGHGLGGDVNTLGRYRKYEEFLVRVLGQGPLPEEAEEAKDGDEAEDGDDD